MVHPTPDPDPVDEAELVETLVRRAVCCPCPYPARIAISYGSGGLASEARAQAVRDRVRASRHDMSVTLDAGFSSVLPGGQGRHFCAVLEVDRDVVT